MPQMERSKFRDEATHSRHSLSHFQVKVDEYGFQRKPAECQAPAFTLQYTLDFSERWKPEGVGGHDVYEAFEKDERGAQDGGGWLPGPHHQAPKRT